MSFENRIRFQTIEEARAIQGAMTSHVLQNDDGTFSVLSHINCEWCDYCTEGAGAEPHTAKPDPYELQHAAEEEWDRARALQSVVGKDRTHE